MATASATRATRSTAPRKCDVDADTDIDLRDLEAILRALGKTATGTDRSARLRQQRQDPAVRPGEVRDALHAQVLRRAVAGGRVKR